MLQGKSFKNDEKYFSFILKALFVLKIFKFLFRLFGHVKKRSDQKDKINFKIYNVTIWLTNNYNAHIPNISQSKANERTSFGQFIEYSKEKNYSSKIMQGGQLQTSFYFFKTNYMR